MLWAALARLDVIVRTEGRIIPAGKSQIVQHLEGGIVRQILVQEGQVVKAGQTLMELSDIQARSTLGQEKTRQAALLGKEARLLAELNNLAAAGVKPDDARVKAAQKDLRDIDAKLYSARAEMLKQMSDKGIPFMAGHGMGHRMGMGRGMGHGMGHGMMGNGMMGNGGCPGMANMTNTTAQPAATGNK